MTTQVGRISGPLLKSNLIRNDVDLSFDTDLLYFDVTNRRIGINNDTAVRSLLVNGTTKTDDVIVDTSLTAANIEIVNNEISTLSGQLFLQSADDTSSIIVPRLRTNNLEFDNNRLLNYTDDSNVVFRPTNMLILNSNVLIQQNLDIVDDLTITNTFIGNSSFVFGNDSTDTIVFNSSINSNIIPETTELYDIGDQSFFWKDIWVTQSYIGNIVITENSITASNNLEINSDTGNVLIESLIFDENTIEFDGNIELSLINAQLIIDTSTGIIIPKDIFVTVDESQLRFDITDQLFYGKTSSDITFGGVYSQNRLTRVTATPTTNEINFFINNISRANINPSRVFTPVLLVDNLIINTNQITTVNNNNLEILTSSNLAGPIQPLGPSTVFIDQIALSDDSISSTDGDMTIEHTSNGYLKFDNTIGIIIPSGTNENRGLLPTEGTTRWNTELGFLEIFIDGLWQNASTVGSDFATQEEVNNINNTYVLILG
jgi:hypothetical protein